jgi:acyl-coenzyme A thioesterase PaaI-like protein
LTFQSYFEQRADGVCPAPIARSPWNADHQSGVAVAGLLTHALEQVPSAEPMMFARIVIDIVRPVPMKPLALATRVTRDGRRMQNLTAELAFAGEVVASASALRVRLAQTPIVMPEVTYPSPDEAPRESLIRREPRRTGLETRVVKGRLVEPGPGIVWARVDGDFMPGVPASPLVTAMMTCDLGSAISAELDSRQWSFANVDISAHFVRPPRSAWILIDSQTITHGDGVAVVDSTVCDEEGMIGHAHQTLFIAPMGR